MKSRSSKERERQSAVQYKFYLQLCLALLCMYIVFLAGINRTKHYIGCVIASVLLHYFTLASMLWMSAICSFLFWIMVVDPFAKAKFNCHHMIIIMFICWGKLLTLICALHLSGCNSCTSAKIGLDSISLY